MATHYPECKFTGVELATEKIQNLPGLPNITFERENVLKNGFASIENESIDYIHLRCVGSLLKSEDWPKLFSAINRILKPDGIIRIEEMHHSVKIHKKIYLISCLLKKKKKKKKKKSQQEQL